MMANMEMSQHDILMNSSERKYNRGIEAFNNATMALDFFSPLKQRRVSKMFEQTTNGGSKVRRGPLFGDQISMAHEQANSRSIGKHLVMNIKPSEQRSNPKRNDSEFFDECNYIESRKKRKRYQAMEEEDEQLQSSSKKDRFQSVRRKLNFDEDVIGIGPQAFEQGRKRLMKEDNPFLKLLDSADSIPQFEERDNNRNQDMAVDQL